MSTTDPKPVPPEESDLVDPAWIPFIGPLAALCVLVATFLIWAEVVT
jgi:hypothetical protein